jgi:hypothetical protein
MHGQCSKNNCLKLESCMGYAGQKQALQAAQRSISLANGAPPGVDTSYVYRDIIDGQILDTSAYGCETETITAWPKE